MELHMQSNLQVDSTNLDEQDNKQYSYDDTLSNNLVAGGVQTITTDYSAITIGDLASTDLGLMLLTNLDTANFITYGSTDGEWKLEAGEHTHARVTPGKTIQAKANTANVKILKKIFNK